MLRDNMEDGFSPGSMLHLWTAQTDAVLIVRYLCACHVLIQGRPESEERKKGSVGRCTVSSGCGTPDCGWIETASDNFACGGIPLYIHYAVCRGCPCEGFDEREIAVW